MKKLFTIAAAVLVSASMFAAVRTVSYNGSEVSNPEGYFTHDANGKFSFNTKYTGAEYDGISFTSGLKMEGSTKILFTTAEVTNVTIVQSTWSTNTIKFDGEALEVASAEAGTGTCRIYTLSNVEAGDHNITRGSGESGLFYIKVETTSAADHSKATVKSISVDGVKLADFDAETLEYDIELDYGTTIVPTVAAIAGDDATIAITPAESLPGTTKVKCTSYDETATITYNINFTVSTTASNDATLKSLSVDGKVLADFAADKFEYDVELEFDATEAKVTAETNEPHAIALITPAEAIPGSATVEVTAQDGTTELTYTINFTKETETPIIRATHVNGTSAIVKGSIGGTADKKTQDDGKFGGKGHYFGITLANDKTFATGDSLVINLSKAAQSSGVFIGLYEDKEGSTLLWNTGIELGVAGDNSVILPAELNGKATFYIARPLNESNKWNGYVYSISVYRKAAPVDPTAVDNIEASQVVKMIENGQLVIIKNGVKYNAQGAVVR